MNKALLRVLLGLVIASSILAFTLALAPLAGPPSSPAQPPAHLQAPTPTATQAGKSVPGSTTGLVIMSFAIVIIILVPVLLQRDLWSG